MARDIAAGKVQAGDMVRHPDGDWSRVADVGRDGEAVVLVFTDTSIWRVHPLRRVAVNRRDED